MAVCQNIKLHTTEDHGLYVTDVRLNKSAKICSTYVVCVPILIMTHRHVLFSELFPVFLEISKQ